MLVRLRVECRGRSRYRIAGRDCRSQSSVSSVSVWFGAQVDSYQATPCSICSNNIRSSSCRVLPAQASLRSFRSSFWKRDGLQTGGQSGSRSLEGERSQGEKR